MSVNNPPSGGTPIKGNRSSILNIENEKLKKELEVLRKKYDVIIEEFNSLREENKQLRNEVTRFNTVTLANIDEFVTDEEELERETNWVCKNKKNKKRVRFQQETVPKTVQTQREIIEEDVIFETDEEELERETNWILNKSKKKNKNVNETTAGATISAKEPIQAPPPPINIINISDFTVIQEILKDISKNNYRITALNNDIFKLNVTDPVTFRTVSNKLNEKQIQWYTYENKNERPIRIMIRGLHNSCKPDDIVDDLKEQNFGVIEVVNIIKKSNTNERKERRSLPLFMASFSNKESVDSIYGIKYILNTKVKIEALKKNNLIIPQCKRCQGFNHTQKYCSREPRCVSCAGKHITAQCTVQKSVPPLCVNCKGQHPANYRGCEVAKELQRIRKHSIKKSMTKNRINIENLDNDGEESVVNIVQTTQPNNIHSPADIYPTYAQACRTPAKNVRKENDEINSNNELMKLIRLLNQRMEEQSYINEKIFDKLRKIEQKF